MHPETMNPAAANSAGLRNALSLAGSIPEYNTAAIVINRIQRLFCISPMHAATVARLAGLGPQEVRS
ncbi:hypothetical protein ABIE41_001485 [Bosea sp. OAE506]|uniref:hypothetical protein n=1 Tax=Bosea sp. OAE506 TaxID=2663870 RepID=UPI00178A5354